MAESLRDPSTPGCRRARRCRRFVLAVVLGTWAMVGGMGPAVAHETTSAGSLRFTIGWGEEPAYTGFKNSVQVTASDQGGAPVTDVGTSLVVEVSFGDQRLVLPLLPSGRPGEVQAVVVPTRPGTYSFHASGKVREEAIDFTSTCGERTFDCVVDASDVQFPVKDPAIGQLAQRVGREQSRAVRADDAASSARLLALGAGVVAVAALVLATGLGIRARRAPKSRARTS